MSRYRKPKWKPLDFETIGDKKLSATIYAAMIQSDAWTQLSNNARVLYLYMKLQYFGVKQEDKPRGQQDLFYFNKAMATKTYGLYTNMAQFRKDRDMLLEYGFIEEVEKGKNTRTKSIYRFSDKWKEYHKSYFG